MFIRTHGKKTDQVIIILHPMGITGDKTIDKAGADFKQDFTYETYRAFFKGAGYRKVRTKLIDGLVPCAIAVITKEK